MIDNCQAGGSQAGSIATGTDAAILLAAKMRHSAILGDPQNHQFDIWMHLSQAGAVTTDLHKKQQEYGKQTDHWPAAPCE